MNTETENKQNNGGTARIASSELLAKLRKASSDAYNDYADNGTPESLGAHRAFATVIQWFESQPKSPSLEVDKLCGTDRLALAVYGRKHEERDLWGGQLFGESDARLLHDAADLIFQS